MQKHIIFEILNFVQISAVVIHYHDFGTHCHSYDKGDVMFMDIKVYTLPTCGVCSCYPAI